MEQEKNSLKQLNQSYLQKQEMDKENSSARTLFNETVMGLSKNVAGAINRNILDLSKQFGEPATSIPQFKVESSNHYAFNVANDSGTETAAKARFLFDFTVLNKTLLPMLICDSVWLKQIEKESMNTMLSIMKQADKQIFIAVDSFEESETEKFRNSVVLKLSKGHELFGKVWG